MPSLPVVEVPRNPTLILQRLILAYARSMFQLLSKLKANSPTPSVPDENTKSERNRSSSQRSASKSLRKGKGRSTFPRRPGYTSKTSQLRMKGSEHTESDVHPLNLPPDERERHRPAFANMAGNFESMEGDQSIREKPPPLSFTHALGSFAKNASPPHPDSSNGLVGPMPPPHKSPPQSPLNQPACTDAEAYKAAGNKFFKAGDFKKAVAEYGRAVDADATNPTYLSNRSAAYMSMNLYEKALEDVKQADNLGPGNSKVLFRLARIYTALGRPLEALAVYALIQPPVAAKDRLPAVSMHNHIEQAEVGLREGTSGSMIIHALDQAEKGLGAKVEKPRKWRLMRGEAYLRMGNVNAFGDAQNVAMSLLRSNSHDPDALVLRGRILYAQGENEKAIQHFRQALSCDPDFKAAVRYLRTVQKLDKTKEEGNTAFRAGRYTEAVRLYGAALEVDPANKGTNSKILQNRALALMKVCCF